MDQQRREKYDKLMVEYTKSIDSIVLHAKSEKQQYITVILSNDSNEQKVQQIQLLLLKRQMKTFTQSETIAFSESMNKLAQIPDIKDQMLIMDAITKVMEPAKEHEDLISSIGKVIKNDWDDNAKIKAIAYLLC